MLCQRRNREGESYGKKNSRQPRSSGTPQFPVDHGFEPGFGAPCLLFRCMRERKEWGPL